MKGHLFYIVKDICLFARKLIFQVFHDRKKSNTPLGPLSDWSSVTRCKYRTLKDLIDLWEMGHVDQQDHTEWDPAELMLNLALEICDDLDGVKTGSVKVTILKDVGLYNRSSFFPPLSAVSGVACFVRAVTNVQKLRWEQSPQHNLTQDERSALLRLRTRGNLVLMDWVRYLRMCQQILGNRQWYTPIPSINLERDQKRLYVIFDCALTRKLLTKRQLSTL